MKLLSKFLLVTALCAFLASSATALAASEQTVKRAEEHKTVQTATKNFTGTAYATYYFAPNAETATYGALVHFTPGARTHWHIHRRPQTLIITEGIGYTQEWGKPVVVLRPGDIVQCPIGVKHWHGGTATTAMSHIAISEASKEGTLWLEPVTDEQYPQTLPK